MTRLSKAPASYGVSYKGSKNKIAAEVVYNLPSAPLLIDVFAGGAKCQITKVERLFVVKGHEDDYWDLMEAHKPSTLFDQDQRQAMI